MFVNCQIQGFATEGKDRFRVGINVGTEAVFLAQLTILVRRRL